MRVMTPDEWRGKGKSFQHNNRNIFYREDGKGPVLVLLHGFPTSSWDFYHIWPDLLKRYRLIAPDFLGLGFSDKPSSHDYRISEQADMIEALLKRARVQEYHILAHDYGVSVAQELLARHHDRRKKTLRIESVCFLNGGLFPETHKPRLIQRLMLTPLGPVLSRIFTQGQFQRSFSAVFSPTHQPSKESIAHFWSILKENNGKIVIPHLLGYIPQRTKNRERWVGALQRMSVPLKLINGAQDPVSGRHMAERFRELVPQPDITSLEDCGHYPHVEDPKAVLRSFEAFHNRLFKQRIAN